MRLQSETMLSVGMISLALGLLVGQFLQFEYNGIPISSFVEGALIGLSLVMNGMYLGSRFRKKGDGV
jgi:hypothetical protein